MEGDAAAEIGKPLKGAEVDVAVQVCDDDSSATKRLRTEVFEDVAKSSDLNHVNKNLGNSLYRLKQSGHKELSDMVIKHVQKCFMYAIHKCDEDARTLKASLLTVVPHLYGE